MTTSMIDGYRTTKGTSQINQDRREVDMSKDIFLLEPSKTPLTTLLMRLRKRPTKNPEYKHLEDVLIPRTTALAEAAVNSELVLTVTTNEGSYFRANDIVQNTVTGEIMRVTASAASTITVERGWGSTTAAGAMTSGDELLNLGNASEEGSNAPTSKTTKTTTVVNYTEIIRTPFDSSRTSEQSSLYGGSDRAYLRRKHGIQHMSDIERKFWFGNKNEDSSNYAGALRTTGGVMEWIEADGTNVTTLGTAGLTAATLEDFARTCFRFGSSTKFLFCSPLTISKINTFGINNLQMVPSDKTFGISIMRYLSGHGVLNLVRNVIFEGDTYDEYAVCLDLEYVAMRVMQDTILKTNIHANDFDGWKDEYLSEVGLQLMNPKTHGILKNVGGN